MKQSLSRNDALLRLAAAIRQRHRDIVLQWMNTLEESSWIEEAPAFWRDCGNGVEQWVVPR